MINQKIFTVYLQKEFKHDDAAIEVKLNVNNLIPRDKLNSLLTQDEYNQLYDIVLV